MDNKKSLTIGVLIGSGGSLVFKESLAWLIGQFWDGFSAGGPSMPSVADPVSVFGILLLILAVLILAWPAIWMSLESVRWYFRPGVELNSFGIGLSSGNDEPMKVTQIGISITNRHRSGISSIDGNIRFEGANEAWPLILSSGAGNYHPKDVSRIRPNVTFGFYHSFQVDGLMGIDAEKFFADDLGLIATVISDGRKQEFYYSRDDIENNIRKFRKFLVRESRNEIVIAEGALPYQPPQDTPEEKQP